MGQFAVTGPEFVLALGLLASALGVFVAGAYGFSRAYATRAAARNRHTARVEAIAISVRDSITASRSLNRIEACLPRLTERHISSTYLARNTRESRDANEIAEALVASLRSNSLAAVDIANLILDSESITEVEERQRLSREIKSIALGLDASFWDRHGLRTRKSGFPDILKALLEQFFERVRKLKQAAIDLSRSPTEADLEAVLDRALELIDTAAAIIEELRKLGDEEDHANSLA